MLQLSDCGRVYGTGRGRVTVTGGLRAGIRRALHSSLGRLSLTSPSAANGHHSTRKWNSCTPSGAMERRGPRLAVENSGHGAGPASTAGGGSRGAGVLLSIEEHSACRARWLVPGRSALALKPSRTRRLRGISSSRMEPLVASLRRWKTGERSRDRSTCVPCPALPPDGPGEGTPGRGSSSWAGRETRRPGVPALRSRPTMPFRRGTTDRA